MQENREEAQGQIRPWWDSVRTSVYEITLSRLEAVIAGRIEEIHRAAGGGHPSGVPRSESFLATEFNEIQAECLQAQSRNLF